MFAITILLFMSLLSCRTSDNRPVYDEKMNTSKRDTTATVYSNHYAFTDQKLYISDENKITHQFSLAENKNISPKIDMNIEKKIVKIVENTATIRPAFMNPDMSFFDYITKKKIPHNCYFAAFNPEYNVFFLNPYHELEYFLDSPTFEMKITFSGIICIDKEGYLVGIGSNNYFNEPEKGVDEIINVASSYGFFKTPTEVNSLSLTGFFPSKAFKNAPTPSKTVKVTTQLPEVTDVRWAKDGKPVTSFQRVVNIGLPTKNSLADSLLKQDLDFLQLPRVEEAGNLRALGASDGQEGFRATLPDGTEYQFGKLLGEGGANTVFDISITKQGVTYNNFVIRINRLGEATPAPPRTKNSPSFLEDYGVSPGRNYQIIEKGGKDLQSEFASERLIDSKARAETFHEIFDGLGLLHRDIDGLPGLTHWDIKPQNMVRGLDGRIKIIDLDASPPTKQVKDGSPDWTAPERIIENREFKTTVGPKSDVYSTGVMLLQARYPIKTDSGDLLGIEEIINECCGKIQRKVAPDNDPRSIVEINAEILPQVRQALKNKADSLTGSEKEEMLLIRKMLDPTPATRPDIFAVKKRWQEIYPRQNAANGVANAVF